MDLLLVVQSQGLIELRNTEQNFSLCVLDVKL